MSYTFTAKGLLRAYKHFKSNPDTYYQYHTPGIWPDRDWSWQEFRQWFMQCLHNKINRNDTRKGRNYTQEAQLYLERDCRKIREYYQRRIVYPGCNQLDILELKRRYPHIDNPVWEL